METAIAHRKPVTLSLDRPVKKIKANDDIDLLSQLIKDGGIDATIGAYL